jgi:hypothetical protein
MKIPDDVAARIDALQRNDPDEAEAICHALVYALGYVPASLVHTMYMLQDDSGDELRKRVGALAIKAASPGVR